MAAGSAREAAARAREAAARVTAAVSSAAEGWVAAGSAREAAATATAMAVAVAVRAMVVGSAASEGVLRAGQRTASSLETRSWPGPAVLWPRTPGEWLEPPDGRTRAPRCVRKWMAAFLGLAADTKKASGRVRAARGACTGCFPPTPWAQPESHSCSADCLLCLSTHAHAHAHVDAHVHMHTCHMHASCSTRSASMVAAWASMVAACSRTTRRSISRPA